jgi:flagellar P-ring protein precursor FlgI
LKRADFTTAARVADAVNKKFGSADVRPASAQNSALVEVRMPQAYAGRNIEFVSELENLAVDPDHIAKIVINERTGTITAGKDIRIAPIAILHGGLSIEVQTSLNVSQPNEFARGRTAVTPQVGVGVREDAAQSLSLKDGSTIDDLVKGLTAIGATARDVIAILQNLRSSGAFEAEVEII